MKTLILMCIIIFVIHSDIESEPVPDPAPECLPPIPTTNLTHRDVSMAFPMKQPSNYVLKIDKNGDQIHEEFIPQSQQLGHGKMRKKGEM